MGVDYLHRVHEHRWGQQVLCIYDPVEIGVNIGIMCRRFMERELSIKHTVQRMETPESMVRRMTKRFTETVLFRESKHRCTPPC